MVRPDTFTHAFIHSQTHTEKATHMNSGQITNHKVTGDNKTSTEKERKN